MTSNDNYRIPLDRDWDLEDLYKFPHTYAQAYAFIYCLDSPHPVRDREKISSALNSYPWKGGFSYVNVYSMLDTQVPAYARPRIHAISKSSPGWLDLLLHLDVAVQVASSVAALIGSAAVIASACEEIQRVLRNFKRDRRKSRLNEIDLSEEEMNFLLAMADDIARQIDFRNIDNLHQLTQNPEVTLQLLLVHYRRLQILAEFVLAGKIALPSHARQDLAR